MRARVFEDGALRELHGDAAIRDAHRQGRHLWVDIGEASPTTEELLTGVFGVHPLIVEDIFAERSVPKIDVFATHVYIVVHAIRRADTPAKVDLDLLDVVIGENFVLTQHREGPATERLNALAEKRAELLHRGPAWLAHAFIDALVDRFQPHMEGLQRRIEAVEEHVVVRTGTPDGKDLLPELFALRRSIQTLCRTTRHQRRLLEKLSRDEIPQIPEACRLYFRDVYDHLTRIDEQAGDYKDTVSSLVDAYLTVQSNRVNDTMKRLTLLSTVVLPLNFVASFYGMNFRHMPELQWPWGRTMAVAQMVLLAVAVWGWFKAKRWV